MPTTIQSVPNGDIDRANKLEISTTVTFTAAAIVVGLRVFARARYAHLGWDDYLMIQALIAVIIDYVAAHWGLGRHSYYLSPNQRVQQQYYSYIAQIFCVYALTFAKISICCTYVRVVNRVQKRSSRVIRWVCYGVVVAVFVVNSVVVVTFYAHCMPAEKSWDPAVSGVCWPFLTFIGFVLLQGAVSALTDFALCGLPVFLLKDLQIEQRSKVVLCCLMSLGLITGIIAVIRTALSATAIHSPSSDGSYSSIEGLTWAGMERNLAILIGSVPSLHPLAGPLKRSMNRLINELKSSKGSSMRSSESNESINSHGSRAQFYTRDANFTQPLMHQSVIQSSQPSLMRPAMTERPSESIRGHEIV